jgi:hypothetical protein
VARIERNIHMIEFELVAKDFWGKCPERMHYTLNQEVLNSFASLVRAGLVDLENALSNGRTGKRLVTLARIGGRGVTVKFEVSGMMKTAVLTFTTDTVKTDNVGAFYAYCMCATMTEFGGIATSVMGTNFDWQVIEIALEESPAKTLISYLSGSTHRDWIENE